MIGIVIAIFIFSLSVFSHTKKKAEYTSEFDLAECDFSDRGRNPYFSIEPGDMLILEGEDEEGLLVLQITVFQETLWPHFETTVGDPLWVRTQVVEEREWLNDELVEISRNFFSRCRETNAIYYFGEDVDIFEDGVIVGHEGAWRAGEDRALP